MAVPPPHPRSLWLAGLQAGAMLLLLGAFLSLGIRNIHATLPYPQHVDEPAIATAAERMLVTGSLHPSTFNYPALPKYIAAAGLAVGFLEDATDFNGPTKVAEIGNVGFPYYERTAPMATARETFLLFAVGGLLATALLARAVGGDSELDGWRGVIAALVVGVTPLYFFHSWTYLNVDIIGTFFTTCALWCSLRATRSPSVRSLAIVPGVLAGCALASKYTLFPVLASVVAATGLFAPAGQRVRFSAVAIGAAITTYLLLAPYTLLDIPGFLNGIAFEAHHYATGHPGFDDHPGWPQLLFYSRQAYDEFRLFGCAAALAGCAALALRDPRRTAIVAAFPAVTLLLLFRERVHFTRNILALYPVMATFITAGIETAVRRVMSLTQRTERRQWMAAAATIVITVACVPLPHVSALFKDETDSRVRAVPWLAKALAPSWTLVVPDELGIDTRGLESAGTKVTHVALGEARTAMDATNALAGVPEPSVILVPVWGADPLFPGEKKADDLRRVSAQWKPARQFGTQYVQTNHPNPAPNGDPAFGVAPLRLPAEWAEWLTNFDQQYAHTRK